MLKPVAILAALLLACTAFAQGTGLKPSKGSPPAPPTSEVQVPGADPSEPNPGVESVEKIFACLAPGLPKDWRSATIEVKQIASAGAERQFEAKYTYTRTLESTPHPLQPCDATGPARSVHDLNDFLEPEKRQWKRAILTFTSNGKFELKYDYTE